MSYQSVFIADTVIEELSNQEIDSLSNKLQTHVTLSIKTKKGEQLQYLVQQLILQKLSDICLIDRQMSPILIAELFNKIKSMPGNTQVHFLRTNKVI